MVFNRSNTKGRTSRNRLKRTKTRLAYCLVGVLLGLGAPLGSLFFKYIFTHPEELRVWLDQELALESWFYLYMAAGTVFFFTLFAFVTSIIHERLKQQANNLSAVARELEESASHDALTDLFNFGAIRKRLEVEIERSRRYQTPLSCLMMDVDNLKEINDEYGHAAGDQVLRYVAICIRDALRVIDTPARYGGDEFFVMLPVTKASAALLVAERLRSAIKSKRIHFHDTELKTTVSVGVSSFPRVGISDMESLIESADRHLYEAKQRGRDCSMGPVGEEELQQAGEER